MGYRKDSIAILRPIMLIIFLILEGALGIKGILMAWDAIYNSIPPDFVLFGGASSMVLMMLFCGYFSIKDMLE